VKKHLRFIINPRAGVLPKGMIKLRAEALLDTEQFTYDFVETAYAGHARALAQQAAADGVFAAVAVGGDGTVNEVASGILHTQTALAIIPMGSGNGLARHIGLPMNPFKALEALNQSIEAKMDVGYANEHLFLCMSGMGFDGQVAHLFSEKRVRGIFSYLWIAAKEYFSYRPHTYHFEIKSKTGELISLDKKAFLVAFANANQFGNNFKIVPQASVHDGILHACIVKPFSTTKGFRLIYHAFKGDLRENSVFSQIPFESLELHSDGQQFMHVDGETMPAPKVLQIHVEANALRLWVKPGN
jgi:YegS/Rv2252/BmrU family lipid kinase